MQIISTIRTAHYTSLVLYYLPQYLSFMSCENSHSEKEFVAVATSTGYHVWRMSCMYGNQKCHCHSNRNGEFIIHGTSCCGKVNISVIMCLGMSQYG